MRCYALARSDIGPITIRLGLSNEQPATTKIEDTMAAKQAQRSLDKAWTSQQAMGGQ